MATGRRIVLLMIGLLAVGLLLTAPAPADAQLGLPPLLPEPPAPPSPPAAPAPAPATEPAAPCTHPRTRSSPAAPSLRADASAAPATCSSPCAAAATGPTLHATLSGGCADPAGAAAAIAETTYVVRSAQPFTGPFPVAVRVDGTARQVRALFEYRSSCRKPILDPDLVPEVVAGAPIDAGGRFARRQTSVVRLPGGLRIRFTARIAGRFTSDGIRGTVEPGFRVTRDGRLLESCRSKGPARFHAVA